LRKRLVLLGGSGFIGQSLIRYLEERDKRGEYYIIIYDLIAPKFFSGDDYCQGRIEERDKLGKLLTKDSIVIHLAHTTIPAESEDTPAREFEENVLPAVRLIELLRTHPIKGLVYFSSGGTIYGEPKKHLPISEKAVCRPNSFYALAKLSIENLINLAGELAWLNYLIIRPSNPYGPYQELLNRHGAVGRIFQCLISGKEFTVYGKGDTVRDYIYIDDLISGVFCLLEKAGWNQVFNLGAGKGTSLNQLIKLCEALTGRKLKERRQKIRATDIKYNVLDNGRLKKLGWRLSYSLEQGLEKTWTYFQKRR